LSVPNAAHDKTAKLQNLAITKAWEVKFCQPDLINFMLKNNIDMVSGALISKGDIQRMAVCFKSMQLPESVSDKSDKDVVIGSWYDDVGSPEFLDATFTITKTSQGYFLKRLNGDGSSGTYKITKLDNKYKKNNDKFGSYYIIDTEGLKIYDKDGYIRTARKKIISLVYIYWCLIKWHLTIYISRSSFPFHFYLFFVLVVLEFYQLRFWGFRWRLSVVVVSVRKT
jgi:sensor histidine kinase YesM